MQKNRLKEIITASLEKLKRFDSYVIQKRAHETAINHRFAVYLEKGIRAEDLSYFVDIEYNKNGDNPKKDGNDKIRPDIIVHQRRVGDGNLLFIEAKKRKKFENSGHDQRKLRGCLNSNLHYMYSLYVQYELSP